MSGCRKPAHAGVRWGPEAREGTRAWAGSWPAGATHEQSNRTGDCPPPTSCLLPPLRGGAPESASPHPTLALPGPWM